MGNESGYEDLNAPPMPVLQWLPQPLDEMDIGSEVEFGDSDSDGESDRMTTTSDEHGSTTDVVDHDFQWVQHQSDITEEMIEKVNQVPVAEVKKRNPLSLQNLCVVKILSLKLADHQHLTHQLKDADNNTLENVDDLTKVIEAFADPECEQDIHKLYECCCVVSPTVDNWFPRCGCEIELLREMGIVLALASIDNPTAELLGRNAFGAFLHRASVLQTRLPRYYGYAPRFENLHDLVIALGHTINKHRNDFVKLLLDILDSNEDQDRVIHNHARAFVNKYLLHNCAVEQVEPSRA